MSPEVSEAWERLLQEIELAKNYPFQNAMFGMGGVVRNPLLDRLLPSLLLGKAVALLDKAMVVFIESQKYRLSKKHRNSFYGRIELLNEQGKIKDYESVQKVRLKRNELSHEVEAAAGWQYLSTALDIIESELRYLGFVGQRPIYEFFAEHGRPETKDEPGVFSVEEIRFGIKCQGTVAMQMVYERKIFKSSGGGRNNQSSS